ncbi:MAG: hypothetical protein ACLR60_03590 [Clostridium paraputrificum]
MAILAVDKPNMFVIKRDKAKDFITKSNEKKVSNSFLEECKSVSKLFDR